MRLLNGRTHWHDHSKSVKLRYSERVWWKPLCMYKYSIHMYVDLQIRHICFTDVCIYIYIVSHVYSIFYIHTSYFWSTYVHIYIHIHIHVLDKCLGGHDGHVYRYAYPSFILFPQHCQDTQRAGRYDPICPVPNGCEPLTFCSSTVKRPEAL